MINLVSHTEVLVLSLELSVLKNSHAQLHVILHFPLLSLLRCNLLLYSYYPTHSASSTQTLSIVDPWPNDCIAHPLLDAGLVNNLAGLMNGDPYDAETELNILVLY